MDASHKLRMVLDYLPCEACLAQPVADQELLCSICHRLHRQVAVRVTTRSTVILERPSAVAAPVIIPPAIPLVEEAPAVPLAEPEPAAIPTEIITEPYEDAEPVPAIDLQDEPEPTSEARQESRVFGFFRRSEPEAEVEPDFADAEVADFEPREDSYEVAGTETEFADESYEVVRDGREPERTAPVPVVLSESEPETESDFIFRAPEPEPEPTRVIEEIPEEWTPTEEIPLERENEIQPIVEESPWAPPEELFVESDERVDAPIPDESPLASPVEEEFIETTMVEEEPILEAEILEEPAVAAPVEEEVFLAEIVEDHADAAPTSTSDLYRLRGFEAFHERALAPIGIDSIQALAGHDPNELASRAGLYADALTPWVQVADLVHGVGVPVESAIALVAAGVPGPRGLRDLTEQEILDRVEAFGGLRLSGRDIKRWQRRA